MSDGVRIKVHDVMHDQEDFDVSETEDYIESWITSDSIDSVRVASGNRNSPVFIQFEQGTSVSIETMKRVARQAVRGFAKCVNGVDVEHTVRDDNILAPA